MQKMFTKEEIHRKTYLPKRKASGKMSLISLWGLRGELPIVGPGGAVAPPGYVHYFETRSYKAGVSHVNSRVLQDCT